MPQPDIIVTAPLPPFLYEPLKADYRCHDYYAASHKPGLLAAEGARIRGLVQGGGTVTPTSLLDALPKLEIISVFGVGYDGVPVDYCKQRGIKVTNTPGRAHRRRGRRRGRPDPDDGPRLRAPQSLRAEAREWEKRGPGAHDQALRQARRHPRARPHRQGDRASACSALGMEVAYTGRNRQDVPYRFVPDLTALAAESDFLVVASPGGAATRNMVDADVLAALGKKGTLVNIARGSIVDEAALVAALKAGTIKGAGLDVFADEPHIPEALFGHGQRRAAAARRQRDQRDAQGDGRPVQGQPRCVVRAPGRC